MASAPPRLSRRSAAHTAAAGFKGIAARAALQKFISRFNASEPNHRGHCAKIAL
jgi:hypothetical protein